MNSLETKYEIISINENISIHFIYVPKGYEIKKNDLEGFETKKLSRLKDLNRVRLIKHWKENNSCLVKFFTEVLNKKGWDFNKFPNPTAFAAQLL